MNPASVVERLARGSSLGGEAARFGDLFGESFADVRVHTDASAAAIVGEHNASALTVGTNIAFAPGAYRPGTLEGDELLAHELAHVVQQRGAGPAPENTQSGYSSEQLEADADQAAAGAVTHLHGYTLSVPISLLGPLRARAKQVAHFAARRVSSPQTLARRSRDERPAPMGTHLAIAESRGTLPNTGLWGQGGKSTTIDDEETREQLLADLKSMNAGGVFVFYGHGTFHEGVPRGIKTSDGAEATGESIATAISADRDPPTMIVFGGCETASLSERVLNAGVPIVVGLAESVANYKIAGVIDHFMEQVNGGATLDKAKHVSDMLLQQKGDNILQRLILGQPAELTIRYRSGYNGSMTLATARSQHQNYLRNR